MNKITCKYTENCTNNVCEHYYIETWEFIGEREKEIIDESKKYIEKASSSENPFILQLINEKGLPNKIRFIQQTHWKNCDHKLHLIIWFGTTKIELSHVLPNDIYETSKLFTLHSILMGNKGDPNQRVPNEPPFSFSNEIMILSRNLDEKGHKCQQFRDDNTFHWCQQDICSEKIF